MKIGIIGTRGIPNRYGGFEQFAQYLSAGLAKKGHEVYVYTSSLHPYREEKLGEVTLIRCNDYENRLGTLAQFLYDLHCINDARKRKYDALLHLGYTSDLIWYWRWPKKAVHIVNMDGLEWMRSKYSKLTQRFLRHAESLAVRHADLLIADSTGIRQHLLNKYGKRAEYIPYGASVFHNPDPSCLDRFGVQPHSYYLLIARMEPENNIEMIIRGRLASGKTHPLLLVGNASNKYGKSLQKKFRDASIRFIGALYEPDGVNNLRYFSQTYFHGHSAGGTNPSLLEAMACNCRIAAHENIFNKAVLGEDAFYFSSEKDIRSLLDRPPEKEVEKGMQERNREKITSFYNWEKIIDHYEEVMLAATGSRR